MSRVLCVQCGSELRPRHSAEGTPQVSHSLSHMDPEHFFCSLRCAARYGVAAARTVGSSYLTKARAAMRDEDLRRLEIMRAGLGQPLRIALSQKKEDA